MRAALILVLLAFPAPGFAQNLFHTFAQVADGALSDGTRYRTAFTILAQADNTTGQCTLQLVGLTTTLVRDTGQTFTDVSTLTFSLDPARSVAVFETTGEQSFRQGYATLSCSTNVFAQAVYTFLAPDGATNSQATAFSTEGTTTPSFRMILDQRGGARVGIAIANDSNVVRSYELLFGSQSDMLVIPARQSRAVFVDDILPLPVNALGILRVRSVDLSTFGMLALRMTGRVITSVPTH